MGCCHASASSGLGVILFALVDCNNFYASCERAFNPRLEGKPVVVLSNNDGCIIARSNEAKKLGISMGAPFFKWEKFCREHKVEIFSSNYELYGDMSQRVMSFLSQNCPQLEIYSIDEAFLILDGFSEKQLMEYTIDLREKIKRGIGLPVSIGISHTKTLAKVANYIAKNQTTSGVFLLDINNISILQSIPIDKVWGVGHRLTEHLKKLNLHTAADLRNANPNQLREMFSVTLEKTILELRGISCLSLESVQPRKQIISSRSFGKLVTQLSELEEAVSHYVAIASEKLRNQDSLASAVAVFLQTNLFRKQDPQYENSVFFPFPNPTADTGYIIRMAKKCLKHIYRQGYQYHKAGIMLLNLIPNTIHQYDLFNPKVEITQTLMKTVDHINQLYGKNTVFYCAEGIQRTWQIKRVRRSPRYTTKWKEILSVVC